MSKETDKKRIEAIEVWCWRRMFKFKWIDKISNVRVLEIAGEERYGQCQRRVDKSGSGIYTDIMSSWSPPLNAEEMKREVEEDHGSKFEEHILNARQNEGEDI